MKVEKEIINYCPPSGDSNFLITSYYTFNTPYEEEIKELRISLLRHDVPHIIYGYKSRGSWLRNCNATPLIILETLIDFPDFNIVLLDADAIVHGYPELFDTLTCDIAAFKRVNSDAYKRLHKCTKGYHWESGTIFHRNNEKVRQFLRRQISIMDDHDRGKTDESYRTNDLLEDCDLDIGELPISYSRIIGTDQPEEIDVEPVISHKLHGYKYRSIIT